MMADDEAPGSFTLKRWSRRKLEAARAAPVAAPARASAPTEAASAPAVAPAAEGVVPVAAGAAAGSAAAPDPPPATLPPVASLHFDSDFTPFMQPKVDAALKREALKKLFRDPRFNVMDGLDIYIGDYSQPDPISPEMVRQLHHVRSFFDPPKTRVNAQGYVEDVPPEEAVAPANALPAPDAASDAGVPPAIVPEPVAAAQPASVPDRAVAIAATAPAGSASAAIVPPAAADGSAAEQRDHDPSKP